MATLHFTNRSRSDLPLTSVVVEKLLFRVLGLHFEAKTLFLLIHNDCLLPCLLFLRLSSTFSLPLLSRFLTQFFVSYALQNCCCFLSHITRLGFFFLSFFLLLCIIILPWEQSFIHSVLDISKTFGNFVVFNINTSRFLLRCFLFSKVLYYFWKLLTFGFL